VVVSLEFESFAKSIPLALDALGAGEALARQERVLIKPNLVNDAPPPVTTPVACVAALVDYVRAYTKADIVIAEGAGDADKETPTIFEALGYADLARRKGLELVDLNTAPTTRLTRDDCRTWPEMHLPSIALDHYLVSVPVLKAHSLAEVTGAMKNMMGLLPQRYYQQGGRWKKSAFHACMHPSIVELCRYRPPDLSVMDASIGLAEYHLGGPQCEPPLGRILAGFDARQVDRAGAALLGLDWRTIGHLAD
jgi:uncharacterized protein (DUF362 family)